MSKQRIQKVALSKGTNRTFVKNFKFAAATAAVIIMTVFTVGTAAAGTPAANSNTTPENVNVVNTPTVNVGNTPSVSVTNNPGVNVVNTPTVSISGTPNVNANTTITGPGPLTNVGRLASQQVMLEYLPGQCPGNWLQWNADGSYACFDISSFSGQLLIITDVVWSATATAGNTCQTVLDSNNGVKFLRSFSVAAADNIAAKSEHLTTGAKMAVNPRVDTTSCNLSLYDMTGYLVPNQ